MIKKYKKEKLEWKREIKMSQLPDDLYWYIYDVDYKTDNFDEDILVLQREPDGTITFTIKAGNGHPEQISLGNIEKGERLYNAFNNVLNNEINIRRNESRQIKEDVNNFVIFDNGGETYDRYTIINKVTGEVYGADENPQMVSGFGQYSHTEEDPNSYIQKRTDDGTLGNIIFFNELPEGTQMFIKNLNESKKRSYKKEGPSIPKEQKIPAKGIKTIDVSAKEWFDKVNGNSYFSGEVIINYGMKDEKTIKMPYEYGYGDYYLQAAGEFFDKDKMTSLWQWCRDNKIILRSHKSEVSRKKDLMERKQLKENADDISSTKKTTVDNVIDVQDKPKKSDKKEKPKEKDIELSGVDKEDETITIDKKIESIFNNLQEIVEDTPVADIKVTDKTIKRLDAIIEYCNIIKEIKEVNK